MLISIIFYYLFNVELQLYSFAGITISFGIIMDNSIVMIDHIRHKGNKKAFLPILAATLTTLGALMIIFLLEKNQQADLIDFALVIVINLGVSLIVSLYFVPALFDKIKFSKKGVIFSSKRKRIIVNITNTYSRIIYWMRKPRFKWVFLILFILGFGIPLHLLPEQMEGDSFITNTYNKSIVSNWFSKQIRPSAEKIFGGTLRLFTEDVYSNSQYSEPQRTVISITGFMPDGATIQQLNTGVEIMESYLNEFNQIELFETQISSYRHSNILVYLKKGFDYGAFPYELKNLIELKAINIGGLDWRIMGVGNGFSNAFRIGTRQYKIMLEGYNYDHLYNIATKLEQQLLENSMGRAIGTEITSGTSRKNTLHEYSLDFNLNKLALAKVSQTELYNYLKSKIHSNKIPAIIQHSEYQNVKLVSDKYKHFNVWDLKYLPVNIKGSQYKLNELATIEKKKTGNVIKKTNQHYSLAVAYDFRGTRILAEKIKEKNINLLQPKLPIGYKVFKEKEYGWDKEDKKQYYYLFIIIIGIIFFICAILLESLRLPFAIISMIPISFIGVFLAFYLFRFNFDQGGYASFILLSGISVNSALYIINDWNNLKMQYPNKDIISLYFKAFNYKIIPVLLTVISTAVGLIPFIWSGESEVFWFAFAVGSIGGLFFSLLGIFFYLPLLILPKSSNKIDLL